MRISFINDNKIHINGYKVECENSTFTINFENKEVEISLCTGFVSIRENDKRVCYVEWEWREDDE